MKIGFSFATIAAVALALGGCWKSDEPLISVDADSDVDLAGIWVRDGRYSGGIRYAISQNEEGYWFADYLADVYKPEADDRLLAFAPLDGDWYLAQVMKTDGRIDAYGLVKATGEDSAKIDHIDVYESSCTEEIGASEGIVEDAAYNCVFSDLKTLKAIAEAQVETIENGGDIAVYASYSRE